MLALLVASLICGTVLLAAAALKVAEPAASRVALGTYGTPWALWPLVAVETVVGVGVLAGTPGAAYVAAALLATFTAAQVVVLARGGGGAPCGCLGARGTVSWLSAGRTAGLAVLSLFATGGDPRLAVAGAAVATIAATLLHRAPRGALDVADEGPAIGSRTDLAPGLNLFTAGNCRLCARVKRGLGTFTEHDEERDAATWLAASVPGAPYAVHVDADGIVTAKGTVNTAAQARSLTGISRRSFVGRAAALATLGGVVRPGAAEAYHFCGHIYTTDSCPHPTGLPRIDHAGYPLRARDGHRVDDLGRLIDKEGRPVSESGKLLRDADGRPLPVATRTKVCTATGKALRLPDPGRRCLVPLLQGPRAQARRLLRRPPEAHQRRQVAHGLLLLGPQGLLRDVLPDQGAVLMREALIVVALLAGLAGSWSPCGLSMVETLERARGGIVTFAGGALAGGAITFGGLAWLGTKLFGWAGLVPALAVAALLLCALGDAAGRRIVPQVRRQVPESWRRILPVPAAAALYGVLLGLGFTTFLLTFATWALAIACLALGTPATGIAVGLAFGAGRAMPVAILATRADGAAAIAERPDVLRGLRGAVAAALVAAAAALAVAPPTARAASVLAYNASDPSASAGAVAWHVPGGNGQLRRPDGTTVALPGTHPALFGGQVAWIADGTVVIADAATLTPTLTVAAPGADAVALSGTDVAWRAGNTISSQALTGGEPAIAYAASGLGRPALDGRRLVFERATKRDSRILSVDLGNGERRTLRKATEALLLGPTLQGGRLMYVRSTYRRQRVFLAGREVYSTTPTGRRDLGYAKGHHPHHQGYPNGERPPTYPRPRAGLTVTLTDTAFDGDTAYVTRLRHRGSRTETRILQLP